MYNLKHSPFVMSYCTASGRKEGGTESPLKTPYFFTLPISEYLRLFSCFLRLFQEYSLFNIKCGNTCCFLAFSLFYQSFAQLFWPEKEGMRCVTYDGVLKAKAFIFDKPT